MAYAGSSYRRIVAGTTATDPATDTTNWELLAAKGSDGAGAVSSVNGETGVVVLDAADVGAVPTNDSRLSDSRTPSGTAGGSLAGAYPNPTLAAGAVNSAEINAAIKDAAAATASLRTLGTGATQAAAGNHLHTGTYEPAITAGTTSQYRRGDKTWQALDKAAVGLANVDNTSDANKPISTAVQTALNAKASTTASNLLGFGQLEPHPTYTDFNAITDFGWHYVQGATNGPGIPGGMDQYYCLSVSLGSEYAYSQYVCQIAFKRTVPGVFATRFREGGVWGSWAHSGASVQRVFYTTSVPARPPAQYVEWVGQVDPGANAVNGDTWLPTA